MPELKILSITSNIINQQFSDFLRFDCRIGSSDISRTMQQKPVAHRKLFSLICIEYFAFFLCIYRIQRRYLNMKRAEKMRATTLSIFQSKQNKSGESTVFMQKNNGFV